MLEESFSRYREQKIVACGACLGTVQVEGGEHVNVEILAAEDFSFPISSEESPQIMLSGTGFVFAPVVEGAKAMDAYVLLDGNAVGRISTVYGVTVEQKQEDHSGLFERLFRR